MSYTVENLKKDVAAAQRRVFISQCNVSYAVRSIEGDPNPIFRLDTALAIGLSEQQATENASLPLLLQQEFRAWGVGHGLADMLEAINFLLDDIVKGEPRIFGCKKKTNEFLLLGTRSKLSALPGLKLDSDFQQALQDLSKARNCLIHRLGKLEEVDCKEDNELVLRWRGPTFFKTDDQGELREVPSSYRGPLLKGAGESGKFAIGTIERRFAIGVRLHLEPLDLATISWCVRSIVEAISKAAEGRMH